jgi:hypothetical protein
MMLKTLLAFTCLTLSISANAATVTYTASEFDVAPGLAGFIGFFTYDTELQQVTGYNLFFAGTAQAIGAPATGLDISEGVTFLLVNGSPSVASIDGESFFGPGTFAYSGYERSFEAIVQPAGGTFYAQVVPISAAAWLFGSALLGLGVVKRKKA